jgi:hypothetical protein
MAYADRGYVVGKRALFLDDEGLARKQRALADEIEATGNRILCMQVDPDEHFLSSRDACCEENKAAVKYDEVVDALTGCVFRKDKPRTAADRQDLLRTRYVEAHSESSGKRLRYFSRDTAFQSRQPRCVTAAFTASICPTWDGATESSFPSCASVAAGNKTVAMVQLTMMVTRRYTLEIKNPETGTQAFLIPQSTIQIQNTVTSNWLPFPINQQSYTTAYQAECEFDPITFPAVVAHHDKRQAVLLFQRRFNAMGSRAPHFLILREHEWILYSAAPHALRDIEERPHDRHAARQTISRAVTRRR